jgi:hypothetical protein
MSTTVYRKFYVELIGLAGAKFYIGVSYTNVAWWTAYMRTYRWSHQFLDEPKKHIYDTYERLVNTGHAGYSLGQSVNFID